MTFERLGKFGLERRTTPRRAERAVAIGAAGTAGNLRQLGRVETAKLKAVEFSIRRKRDVVDIEIEPHADGIGGDEIIDVAVLEHAVRDDDVRAVAQTRESIERLWEVCQVPDYRKISPAAHAELVVAIYGHLMRDGTIHELRIRTKGTT